MASVALCQIPVRRRNISVRTQAPQRARNAQWRRAKMATAPDSRANQRDCQQRWAAQHPQYWRQYRQQHAASCARRRQLPTASGPPTPCPFACKDGRASARPLHSPRYLSSHPRHGCAPCNDGCVIAAMPCDANHIAVLATEDMIDPSRP